MNQINLEWIMMFFSYFLHNLPSLIVCAIACFLLTTRTSKIAGAPHLALWGFGLAIGTGIVMPLLYTLVFAVVSQTIGGTAQLGVMMFGLGVVGTLLQMTIYILLLMSLFKPNPHRHSATAQQGDSE
jgi:hypothetical protein